MAKYNRGANKLTPSKTAFIVFPTLYAGGVYQDQFFGYVKIKCFFCFAGKNGKTAFIIDTDSLQYFLETPRP